MMNSCSVDVENVLLGRGVGDVYIVAFLDIYIPHSFSGRYLYSGFWWEGGVFSAV